MQTRKPHRLLYIFQVVTSFMVPVIVAWLIIANIQSNQAFRAHDARNRLDSCATANAANEALIGALRTFVPPAGVRHTNGMRVIARFEDANARRSDQCIKTARAAK